MSERKTGAAGGGGRRALRLPAVLGTVTVLLGGFTFWAHQQASRLNDRPSARNAAITDNARTSQVKGEITEAVNTVFSYNHTDPERTARAARDLLTGRAVQQYEALFGPVRREAPAQKLVLTTSVTESAVRTLQGDRARLLIFADQRNTRTSDGRTSYSAAMLAVEAVRRSGHWKIAAIDTFTGTP